MDKFLKLLLFPIMLAVSCCCQRLDIAGDVPFRMESPEGEMTVSAHYLPVQTSDDPGCFEVIGRTNGRTVYTSLSLFLVASHTAKPGEELKPERLHFGAYLSSFSGDYTSSYSGKFYLKEKTDEKIVIRMQNVHLMIAHGEYVLNGDLVATR